jgi:hypothetical protein
LSSVHGRFARLIK